MALDMGFHYKLGGRLLDDAIIAQGGTLHKSPVRTGIPRIDLGSPRD